MIKNLYKHNSRSYYDIYTPLTAAYPRLPVWMFQELAGLFDFQSELMNRIATDILYPITRESAYAFADRNDYDPVEADGATDTLTITLTGAMTKTIAAGYQVGGISSSTGKMVVFETTAAGSSGGTDTITVAAKQKKSYSNILVGTVENDEDFYDYPIDGYTNIIASSISLLINGVAWTRVLNFDASVSDSKHFRLIYQSSGKVRIQFGDGITGEKPAINSVIYASFSTTSGLLGMMNAGDITINIGGDSDISAITNAGSTGGHDSESVNSIIRNARRNVRARSIVWSEEDLETAAYASSSSIIKAKGVGGIGTGSVYIIPSGGGTPGGALIDSTTEYIMALTQFGKMPVTVSGASFTTSNITATITVRDGFTESIVQDLVEFALSLTFMANDVQIIDEYDENGIDSCRTNQIAVLFPGLTFTSAENDALEFIILKWKTLLADRDFREWGQYGEIGDLWTMGNELVTYGVDVFSLTSPTENVVVASDAMLDVGTVTITVS